MLQITERPDAHLIQTVLLRSIIKRFYSPDNVGHFGLAMKLTQLHLPIRRYPDLLVHRAIRSVIRSKMTSSHVRRVEGAKAIQRARIYPYQQPDMIHLGEHCSLTGAAASRA